MMLPDETLTHTSLADHWMVVGALTDLGRAVTWQMAQLGQGLILVDQSAEALIKLADALEAKGYAAPHLVAIDRQNLELGCQHLADLLQVQYLQDQARFAGFVWTGYHLASPAPTNYVTLADWQEGLLDNLTYPYWILRTCINTQAITSDTPVWLALPQAVSFTHAMSLSTLIWSSWRDMLEQEWGQSAPKLNYWHLPRVADRIHRRIWPLAPLESFTALDDVVIPWVTQVVTKL